MAHKKGHTAFVHDNHLVQREFERVYQDKEKEVKSSEKQISGPSGGIAITSQDDSITVNGYDLSVWNYQTKWEYIFEDPSAPYNSVVLPANRVPRGGYVPFRIDQAVIRDDRNYCNWSLAAQYEPNTGMDSAATDALTRDRFYFRPTKSGTYHFDAEVTVKEIHPRDLTVHPGEYYDGITDGILFCVKLKYEDYIDLTTLGYYTPAASYDGLADITTRNDYYDIFDKDIKINREKTDELLVIHPEVLQVEFVNEITLEGGMDIYISEDEVVLVYYKFDTRHIYWDDSSDWLITTDTYVGIKKLYERLNIHFVGIYGKEDLAIGDRIKNMVENFNI